MAVMTYREALNLALREEMRRDPRVFVMGEEVGLYEGAYKVTQGLLKEFGPRRVVDTPIAESGFTGIGIGAAMLGLRPVVEMMTFNFSLMAMDQIVNTAAKLHYMSGGQFSVPLVIRGPGGPAASSTCRSSSAGRAARRRSSRPSTRSRWRRTSTTCQDSRSSGRRRRWTRRGS